MVLYKISKDEKMDEIEEKEFKSEKHLEQIVEGNLDALFGLEFIDTEHIIGQFRIDTIAYNPLKKFCNNRV